LAILAAGILDARFARRGGSYGDFGNLDLFRLTCPEFWFVVDFANC